MIWHVVFVENNAWGSKPLTIPQTLLLNECWELKLETRSTEAIVEAAVAKYPAAKVRFTSRFFGCFREAWLEQVDKAVAKYLGQSVRDLSIEIVVEVRI